MIKTFRIYLFMEIKTRFLPHALLLLDQHLLISLLNVNSNSEATHTITITLPAHTKKKFQLSISIKNTKKLFT